MRKMINRKGSTLALTIIIFAVLMIFATFTLGFMVTENKQAMYHQNKTQAYYIARSGAEIADAAIRKQLRTIFNNGDEKDVNLYLQKLNGLELILIEETQVQELGAEDLKIIASIEDYNGNDVLIVKSDVLYNGVKESVSKIITSNLANLSVIDKTFSWDGQPIVAISGAWSEVKNKSEKLDDKYAKIVGENSIFKPYIFPIRAWDIPVDYELSGPSTLSGYIFDESVDNSGVFDIYSTSVIIDNNLNISGEVNEINIYGNLEINGNIFVEGETVINVYGNLIIDDIMEINMNGNSSDLEFFVYNLNDLEDALSIDLVSPQGAEIYSNFYIRSGRTTVELKKSYLEGSITSNDKFSGETIDSDGRSDEPIPQSQYDYNVLINSQDSSGKIDFNGTIWAPDSYVVIGGHVLISEKAGINQDGMVLGKYIEVEGLNENMNYKEYLDPLLDNSLDGTTTPVEIEEEVEIRALEFNSYFVDINN